MQPGKADRIVIAYKSTAHAQDPVLLDLDSSNDQLATTKWRSPPVHQPEASLLGGMYLEGAIPFDGNLVIQSPTHWIMRNTGLHEGDQLPGLLGYEVDGDAQSAPANRVVIARSPVGQRMATATIYEASSGAIVFNAGTMQWAWGLDDYNREAPGSSRVHPAVQQMTRNLLARFLDAPTH